jgi:CRISPR-associated DxTHG motif protein
MNMKKKAVVTLLGMIGHTKLGYISKDGEVQKRFTNITPKDRAKYYFSEKLKKFSTDLKQERYINTFPLLIDIFEDRDIIPIATQKARNVQEKTLSFLKLDKTSLENTVIIDETDYEGTFQQISELLENDGYESFIIDLTHGFRHLPILMIVNLIISSIKDIDKIEHIFFAKEIINAKEYEIIDLLDYIGLAKLSFVLENFNTNYTVGNKLVFKNEKYQDLVDSLRIISGHILANSLKSLLEGDESLVQKTIYKLNTLQLEDKNIATFSISIKNIIKHLTKIEGLKNEKDYIKLFKLSQMMKEREYLLNSITLLNESVGMYCAHVIRSISSEISKKIDIFIGDKEFSLYALSHQSKNLVKLENSFTGSYLSEHLPKKEIIEFLRNQNHVRVKSLIEEVGNLRNNLAHGNSSDKIENVKFEIGKVLKEYQSIVQIANDINVEEKEQKINKSMSISTEKKEKVVVKGIDASKEKMNDLFNSFKNR